MGAAAPLANVLHLFADEFTRLGRRGVALTFIALRPLWFPRRRYPPAGVPERRCRLTQQTLEVGESDRLHRAHLKLALSALQQYAQFFTKNASRRPHRVNPFTSHWRIFYSIRRMGLSEVPRIPRAARRRRCEGRRTTVAHNLLVTLHDS
jgi:hypothetical protein